ncbi:hypothetical protein MKW98_000191, partial [Papaver atlanticum]
MSKIQDPSKAIEILRKRLPWLIKKMKASLARGNPMTIDEQEEFIDLLENIEYEGASARFDEKRKSKRIRGSAHGQNQDEGAQGRPAKRGRG